MWGACATFLCMDAYGRYGSYMDGLLRRQASESGDEGSLDWLDRLRADVAADREARWDAAGSSVGVVPGVTVGASDVLVESRDITPAPVDRGDGVVSFPREVESRVMEGVVPAGDGGIDFSRVGEGVLGALSAFERQTSGQIRYLADWVRSGERPEGLDPESEWGDIFRDAGLSEPVSAVLGFGLALMEPGIPGLSQFSKGAKVGGLAGSVNPMGLAAGVAGEAFESAPSLVHRGGIARDLTTVAPRPDAIIRDLDAAMDSNVPIILAGNPAFRRLREDAHALYALGYDPRDWSRDGASGLVLFKPKVRVEEQMETMERAYNLVMDKADVIDEYLQRGLDIGAEKWYEAQDILDIAIAAIGDPLSGRAAFDMLNELSAIASTGTPVPKEIDRAVWLWTTMMAGTPLNSLTKADMPPGLGSDKIGSMLPGWARFALGEDPFRAVYKTPSYASNKSGDLSVFTGDRWMDAILRQVNRGDKLGSGKPFNYNAEGTGYIKAYLELADRANMKAGRFQSAVWVGTEAVDHPEAWTQVFWNRMNNLAKERGEDIIETTKLFFRGELGLQDILGGNIVSDLSRRAAFEVRQDRMSREGEGEPSE